MLTAANISSEMAVNYFIKNYHHEGKSQWSGFAAQKLGLSGAVDNKQEFKNVIEGLSPDGHSQLNARVLKPDERRAALDCTFSAPKSLSMMALVGGDERLIQAHHQALSQTIRLMEQRYATTRVTEGGGRELGSCAEELLSRREAYTGFFPGASQPLGPSANHHKKSGSQTTSRHRVNTGNLLVAQFDHIESRELDPHLHTHCLVMNTTQTADGKWMSLVNGDIYANKKFLGMAYQSYLAREVQKLGYEIESRPHGQFELIGYKQQDLSAFSKRRQQIVALAGANSSWEKRNQVWDKTRQRKQKITQQELQASWKQQAAALGISFVIPQQQQSNAQPANQHILDDAQAQPTQAVEKDLSQILDDAIAHCSERNVAFKFEDIAKFVLFERLATDVADIEPLLKQHPSVLELPSLETQYTTWAAVNREIATIELMEQGKHKVAPISHPEVIESQLEKTRLNIGQRQAVTMAATTDDQFVAWQGVAGAGKTFALKELRAIATSQGYTIKAFAPSSMAAKVLSEELGITGETVARLLVSEPPSEVEENQIWIVDEAGLLSAKDAHALFERATQEKARLLLVGDTKQLSAVEAGNPFKCLQQAGMKTAHLTESNRQRNPSLKIAVDLIADGRVEAGFKQLETIGSICEVSPDTKLQMIADSYMALTPEQRNSTLVLAGTNVERLALTQTIRDKLKVEGSLGNSAYATQLQTKNLTKVQMQYTHNYELGDVVMPTRNYKRRGLEKSKLYKVVGKNLDQLTLLAEDGTHLEVDTAFDKAVYQRRDIEIAVGDRLVWKKNDRINQRRNGQEFIVTAIDNDNATIAYLDSASTETINLKQAHNLDYALVSTTYSSQGKTAREVLISADSTIGQESFYVGVSRARDQVKIFTTDKDLLLEQAQKSKAKENALELLRQQLKQQSKVQSEVSIVIEQPVTKTTLPPPILKTDITVVISPQSVTPLPLLKQQKPTQAIAVEKPKLKQSKPVQETPVQKPKLKKPMPTEAFWIPASAPVPDHLDSQHWSELVDKSAIHPEIAASNFQSLHFDPIEQEHFAWEYLMYSPKISRRNDGRLRDGHLNRYRHIEKGGWWCNAGVDPRSFAQASNDTFVALKMWGCYKPNTPRPKLDQDGEPIPGKFIKYEHPPKVDTSIFLLNVPDCLQERIYSKYEVNPSDSDRKSGFWYCVWKHNIPITITEGAKKAASLLSQGHAAIGLPGISMGYRSPKDEYGNKIGKSYLNEELAVFATSNREIKFCFDYETKPETLKNIQRDISVTGWLLQKQGAKVLVVTLPGPDKGVDDFIVAAGPLAYEHVSYSALSLRDWQQHNRQRNAETIQPPSKPIPKAQTNGQQQSSDTNREDREVINDSRTTQQQNRGADNYQPEIERENPLLGSQPARKLEELNNQLLGLSTAINEYLELQEIFELGTNFERINQSFRVGRLRGQRATNLSTNPSGQDSAISNRTENHDDARQLNRQLNTISENIQLEVIDSALAQTLPSVTKELLKYQQQLATAKTTFNDLSVAIANYTQQSQVSQALESICQNLELRATDSAVAQALPSVTKELLKYQQQLATAKTTFDDLSVAIANHTQQPQVSQALEAICQNLESTSVDSALAQTLPSITEEFLRYQQQLATAKTTFNDLSVAIANSTQQSQVSQALEAISQNLELTSFDYALAQALPPVKEELLKYQQQLATAKTTFNDLSVAIANSTQQSQVSQALEAISQNLEHSTVDSALAQALPSAIEQISQCQQQFATVQATILNQLSTAVEHQTQILCSQNATKAIAEFIEQSSVDSTLTQALPQLIEQLSSSSQISKALKLTFNQLSTAIEHQTEILCSQNATGAITDLTEQSAVSSTLTQILPQLVEQLSSSSQLSKALKPIFNQFTQTIATDSQTQIKETILNLDVEKLATLIEQVSNYFEQPPMEDDPQLEAMRVIRQIIRDENSQVLEKLESLGQAEIELLDCELELLDAEMELLELEAEIELLQQDDDDESIRWKH